MTTYDAGLMHAYGIMPADIPEPRMRQGKTNQETEMLVSVEQYRQARWDAARAEHALERSRTINRFAYACIAALLAAWFIASVMEHIR